ncbi:MAG: HEAT repeat domain-containing protein [Balneolaceae bacterium]|nr:HEAT repeat domain-containing protein [Balneolaceae bacterium]
MSTERIKQLLDKYAEGESTLEEERELRGLLAREDLPGELRAWRDLFDYYGEAGRAVREPSLDPLARIDFGEEGCETAGISFLPGLTEHGLRRSLRAAAAVILLLAGFAGGLLVNRTGAPELTALQKEVSQMKEVLVYGSPQQTSASERISAINFSTRLPAEGGNLDPEIRDILVWVMNSDQSVNVRLEAAEALNRYRGQPEVRRSLVNTLSRQESPVMQLTLIDMLVEMNATGAINEMQKLLMKADTREMVRPELEAAIATLKGGDGV